MKTILHDKNYFVLRFDKDEDVLAGILKVMKEEAISACAFFGIGACSSVELAYYNTHIKNWRTKPFVEDLEIISFSGNGGLKDGQPVLHSHGMFGRTDFSTIGGHVSKMAVSITCEIFLTQMDGTLDRRLDDGVNLSLLV